MKIFLFCVFMLITSQGYTSENTSSGESGNRTVPGIASHENRPEFPAAGWGELQFDAPEPGTYELPPTRDAADGQVLTAEGKEKHLADFYGDKIVILSFIYTHCSDLNGCPLVTAVFYKLKQTLKDQPEVADQLRLISLSFDPVRDTPEVMKFYGIGAQDMGGPEWRFLTTKSKQQLSPILERFGQSIVNEYDDSGEETGSYAHILRVFLIDKEGRIRNQYGAGFLHEQSLISDVKTLLIEEGEL